MCRFNAVLYIDLILCVTGLSWGGEGRGSAMRTSEPKECTVPFNLTSRDKDTMYNSLCWFIQPLLFLSAFAHAASYFQFFFSFFTDKNYGAYLDEGNFKKEMGRHETSVTVIIKGNVCRYTCMYVKLVT